MDYALSCPRPPAKREIGTSLSEINVTPFIDVMLVLLIIFMVTAPMMQSGIGVNLPQAETDNGPGRRGPDAHHHPRQVHPHRRLGHQHQPPRAPAPRLFRRQGQEDRLHQGRQGPPLRRPSSSIMDIAKKAGVEIDRPGDRAHRAAVQEDLMTGPSERAACSSGPSSVRRWSTPACSSLIALIPEPPQAGPKGDDPLRQLRGLPGRRRRRDRGRRDAAQAAVASAAGQESRPFGT